MPLFLITTRDKADALPLRLSTRPTHLDWMKGQGAIVKLAGARWTDAAEPRPCGSTLLIEAESLDAARAWAAEDPYAKAGVFADTEVQEIRPAVGEWLPG